jgi:hypothetical protein
MTKIGPADMLPERQSERTRAVVVVEYSVTEQDRGPFAVMGRTNNWLGAGPGGPGMRAYLISGACHRRASCLRRSTFAAWKTPRILRSLRFPETLPPLIVSS